MLRLVFIFVYLVSVFECLFWVNEVQKAVDNDQNIRQLSVPKRQKFELTVGPLFRHRVLAGSGIWFPWSECGGSEFRNGSAGPGPESSFVRLDWSTGLSL